MQSLIAKNEENNSVYDPSRLSRQDLLHMVVIVVDVVMRQQQLLCDCESSVKRSVYFKAI